MRERETVGVMVEVGEVEAAIMEVLRSMSMNLLS